jgi:TRAP-type mannitol/chloroaromatic compound transport system permease large subunit
LTNVTIFQFSLYDISADEIRKSRRWAIREVIEALGGAVIEETATVVDASVVALGASSIEGMTRRGFDPYARAAAQTRAILVR